MAVGPTIQVRRATTSAWASANPTLAAGEIGLDTTTGTFKIGDGSTAWASLAYHAALPVSAAASDFIVGDGTTTAWIKKTLAQTKTILGIGGTIAASTATSDFLVGDSTTGNWIKKSLAETKTILGFTEWASPAFDAANFSAYGSMTWTVTTGDVESYAYRMLSSDTMLLTFKLAATTVGGTASPFLKLKIPNGKTAALSQFFTATTFSGGVGAVAPCETIAADTWVYIHKNAADPNWSLETNAANASGTLILQVS